MEPTEYEKAWDEGEEKPNAPATNALRSAAQMKADKQAQEFSDAFFADEKPAEEKPSDVKTDEQK